MTQATKRRELLGVLGGLGPIASAEFLRTVYETCAPAREQNAPRVVLYSDPTFPDRTETLLAGGDAELLAPLADALLRLRALGAARTVICCVTMHHLLPQLEEGLRREVWSLLDAAYDELLRERRRALLVCTTGTRRLEIFERHPRWKEARELLVMPRGDDQALIHELIYRVKRNQNVGRVARDLRALLDKYRVEAFVAGCTEIHVLAKHFICAGGEDEGGYRCIDPLTGIARELAKESI